MSLGKDKLFVGIAGALVIVLLVVLAVAVYAGPAQTSSPFDTSTDGISLETVSSSDPILGQWFRIYGGNSDFRCSFYPTKCYLDNLPDGRYDIAANYSFEGYKQMVVAYNYHEEVVEGKIGYHNVTGRFYTLSQAVGGVKAFLLTNDSRLFVFGLMRNHYLQHYECQWLGST